MNDDEVSAQTHNLSLKGALCTVQHPIAVDQSCTFKIELGPGIEIRIGGKIVRAHEKELAIDFIRMDENSFFHLKKLIEYNANDPERIGEELSTPAFDAET